MRREYYFDSIEHFLSTGPNEVLGLLTHANDFTLEQTQRDAWEEEIRILQAQLSTFEGSILLEYSIPRMGKRIDAVLLIGGAILVLEFKVGQCEFSPSSIEQVWDYALDLKNFHEPSHHRLIAPILIATEAKNVSHVLRATAQKDNLLFPILCDPDSLAEVINKVLLLASVEGINSKEWLRGRYRPTPTIIEAAIALYNNHSVSDIARSDADAINLSLTSETINNIIQTAKQNSLKIICFVTGVPGAGKTLVGLKIATQHLNENSDTHSVFLSGNGPLVAILREALARDKILKEKEHGRKVARGVARSEVKVFIQNVHHFRDDCLANPKPTFEHIAIFDEAQRAWNVEQTSAFMRRKKGVPNFHQSEPEFLISCLDRHPDWAVIVCLVGGGQEIDQGEAGIGEWIDSLNRSFPEWQVCISSRLTDSEYASQEPLRKLETRRDVLQKDELHLSVSMRSFRAEHVSLLVKQLLDLDLMAARSTFESIREKYPIVITRDISKARHWLKSRASGSERYGIMISSEAERLKPHALTVRPRVDPVHWFLDGREDVRSSYYLEDAASEFEVQGLELDWACITWDADFRRAGNHWEHWSFRGARWEKMRKPDRQNYLKNAYRVLLTRARQGMVLVVPPGDADDPTRKVEFYDPTFEYLKEIGFELL